MGAAVYVTDDSAPSGTPDAAPQADAGQKTLDFLTAIKNTPAANDNKAAPAEAEPVKPADPGAATLQFLKDAKEGNLPEPKRPYQTSPMSLATNAAAGFNEAVADTLGAPVDAASYALHHPLQVAQKLTPAGMAQPFLDLIGGPKIVPDLPSIPEGRYPPIGGSQSIKQAMGLIGANPDTLEPQNGAERIARGLGGGVASAMAPEAVVGAAGRAGAAVPKFLQAAFGNGASMAAVASNAAIGGTAGATGEAAAEAVPDDFAAAKPFVRAVGNLAGGAGAAAIRETPALVGAGVKAAQDFAAPMTSEGQQRLAEEMLAKGATDRQAALTALQNGPTKGVGDVPLTTYQVTGDTGIGAMDRAAETGEGGVGPFNARRAAQNEARVGAVKALQPTGDPAAVAGHIRDHLADIDEMTAGIQRQVEAAAQAKAAPIGTGTPEGHGAAMREGLADSLAAAKARESALWKAVDPDGKLAMGSAPISTAARRIETTIPQAAKGMEGEEAAIFKAAKDLETVSKFSEITALRSRISDEMRAQRGPNGNPTVLARLTQLRGAVEKAIEDAAEHKAGQEVEAVKSGAMKPEEAMASRLQAKIDEFNRSNAGGSAEGEAATARAANAASLPPAIGARSEGSGRFGNAPGDSGLPKAGAAEPAARAGRKFLTPEPERAPTSLLKYLAARGGIKLTPDLQAIFGRGVNPSFGGIGRLFTDRGMSLDDAIQSAKEGHYLVDPGDFSGGESALSHNDILDLIANEAAGDKAYPLNESGTAAQHEWLGELRAAESLLRTELKESGINPNKVDRDILHKAIEMMASGEQPNPSIAYEQAVMHSSDSFAAERAERIAETGPIHGHDFSDDAYGAPPREFAPPSDEEGIAGARGEVGARGGQSRSGGQSDRTQSQAGNASPPLTANLDENAAARIRAASEATKERAQTFKQGAVGETLAEMGAKGNYRILDSQVGAKFFKPGNTGTEAVSAFRTAVGDRNEAAQALEGFAGLSLRKAAMTADGTIDPGKFATWQKAHADALRAMPEVAAKFADAAKASEAVADATAMRAAALDGYQKTALGKFLKLSDAGDVTRTVGEIFGSKTAIQDMRTLASEVANNPDAREGLRKAVADYMTSKFVGNTEQIKSDAFQTFVRENKPVLAQVFSHDELKGIEAVAAELSRVKRLADLQALPGRSTTAQDLIKPIKEAGEGHGLSPFAETMVGAVEGFHAMGVPGAVGGAAAAAAKQKIMGARAAGMQNVQKLVRGMLLNPELARAALERAPTIAKTTRDIRFAQQLNRVAAIAAQRQISQKQAARR